MKIDECGIYAEQLKQIHSTILKKRNENGEPQVSTEYLDKELYDAFQKILSIATNPNAIAIAMNNFSKRVESGNASIEDLSVMATEAAMEVIIEETEYSNNEPSEAVAESLAIMTILGMPLTENEKETVAILCSDEMEASYKDVFEKANNGDETSQKVKDLINRAESYIVNRDKLNPKGADSGAIALIFQLTSTGDEAALLLAKKIASTFGLDEVLENGNVAIDKVREAWAQRQPNKDLDSIVQRHNKYVTENKDTIVNKGVASNRENVAKKLEERRILEFSRQVQSALKQGNVGEVARLVKYNVILAQKAFENDTELYSKFGVDKKGGENLYKRIVTIGSMLGREIPKFEQPTDIEL